MRSDVGARRAGNGIFCLLSCEYKQANGRNRESSECRPRGLSTRRAAPFALAFFRLRHKYVKEHDSPHCLVARSCCRCMSGVTEGERAVSLSLASAIRDGDRHLARVPEDPAAGNHRGDAPGHETPVVQALVKVHRERAQHRKQHIGSLHGRHRQRCV